ncbi:MAG: acyl-CoA dehydrogenase family protein [Acidimicrobiales bacterium]
MSWDFETDPAFQAELDWVRDFVEAEIAPLDHVIDSPYDVRDPIRQALIPPLQAQVRARGLWACHLGPDLGGPGYGQVKLGLLNEILGTAKCAPTVFGCQAPDSGNSEILAHYGTPEQKQRFLEPLLRNDIVSCFSMTEPQGGADPKVFTCRAEQDGDEWVINGEKWFSSNARYADFFITMAVTDPDNPPYQRMSMFLVPADTPGIINKRDVALGYQAEREGSHAYLEYRDVRVPKENMLGERGGAFVVAQTRLGGGRIHHAMRTVGQVRKAFDMMCERAVSRTTQGEMLGRKQMVQDMVAQSWIDIECFRLLVLQTAWKIDKYKDYKRVRQDIAAVKAMMPRVFHDVAARALQIHGSLGVSNEMPFAGMVIESFHMGLADGPTEVHKATLARLVLADHAPTDGLFPTQHTLTLRQQARERFAELLEQHVMTEV